MAINIIAATSLTGNEQGSLKNINSNLIQNKDVCFVIDNNIFNFYRYDKTSILNENLPYIVIPGNNPSYGRWFLISIGNITENVEVLDENYLKVRKIIGNSELHLGHADSTDLIFTSDKIIQSKPFTSNDIYFNELFNADLTDGFHATKENIPNTIPVRDGQKVIHSSTFSGFLSGTAEQTNKLANPIYITIEGEYLNCPAIETDLSENLYIPLNLLPHKQRHIDGDDTIFINQLQGVITRFQHGFQTNEDLHAIATAVNNGFLSKEDFIYLHNHNIKHQYGGDDEIDIGKLKGKITRNQHNYLETSTLSPTATSGDLHNVADHARHGFMSREDKILFDKLTQYKLINEDYYDPEINPFIDYQSEFHDRLLVDTTNREAHISLPEYPSFGDEVQIIDAKGTFDFYNVIVYRAGKRINGEELDFVLRVKNTNAKFIFLDNQTGWIYRASTGISGEGGQTLFRNVAVTEDYDTNIFEKLWVDSTGGPIEITLPEFPEFGDEIKLFDIKGTFNTNNITLLRNGKRILGETDNVTLDVDYTHASLLYYDEAWGWVLNVSIGEENNIIVSTLDHTQLVNHNNDPLIQHLTIQEKNKIPVIDIHETRITALEISGSQSTSHNNLVDRNGDPNYLHITQDEKDLYDGYDDRINDLEDRVDNLENILFGAEPVIGDSNIHEQVDVDHEALNTYGKIVFPVYADGIINFDPSKVITTPNIMSGAAYIIPTSEAFNYELTLPIHNVAAGVTYTLNILQEAIKNSGTPNTYIVTNTFTTVAVDEPQIENSNLFQANNVNINTTNIIFPVYDASGFVEMNDDTKFDSFPFGKVTSMILEEIGENYQLNLTLTGLNRDKQYNISILPNAIKNISLTNSYTKTDTFYTQPSNIILQQSNVHNTIVNNTLTQIEYDLDTETGNTLGGITLDFPDNILVTSGSMTISSVTYSNKKLYVNIDNVIDGENISIVIPENTISNNDGFGNKGYNNQIITEFEVSISEPIIHQSSIHNEQNVDYVTLTQISYPLEGTLNLSIQDYSEIIMSPNIISGTPFIQTNDTLIIPVSTPTENMFYNITIEDGAIGNGNMHNVVTNTSTIETSFRMKASPPIIGDSNLHGNTYVSPYVDEIIFPITYSDFITLNPARFNCNISGAIGTPTFNTSTNSVHIPLNIVSNTYYSINILSNGVLNRDTGNPTTKNTFFTTGAIVEVGQSSIHNTTINRTQTIIDFPVNDVDGTLSIHNINNISVSGGITLENAEIIGSPNRLRLTIDNADYSGTYSITINPNTIEDDVSPNENTVTCNFTTFGDIPVISQNTDFHNKQNVLITETFIEYDITASGVVSFNNAALITASPNIITTKQITGSVGNYKIRLGLSNIQYNTNYTITLNENCIINDGTLNTSSVITEFKTELAPPIILQNNTYHNNWFEYNEISYIDYDVTFDGNLMLDQFSNVNVIGANLNSVNIVSNRLRLILGNFDFSTPVTINIGQNVVKNQDNGNQNTIETNINIKGDSIIVDNSSLNEEQSVEITTTQLTFPLTTTNGGPLGSNISVDIGKVLCNVSGIIQSVNISGTNLVINVNNLDYNTNYEFTIEENAITNDETNISNQIITTFKTKNSSPEILTNTSICGQMLDHSTLIQLDFDVDYTGTLELDDPGLIDIYSIPVGISIDNEFIDDDKLKLDISDIDYGMQVFLTIPDGVVKNEDSSNENTIYCDFTTYGAEPIIGTSPQDGQDEVNSTFVVTFPLSVSSGGIEYILHSGEINVSYVTTTSSPTSGYLSDVNEDYGYISDIFIDGSDLKVELSDLVPNAIYSVFCGENCISNFETYNTGTQMAEFTTIEEAEPLYEWSLDFVVTPGVYQIFMSNVNGWNKTTHEFSLEEMYGETFNCDNMVIELFFRGYGTEHGLTNPYEPNPEVPKSVLKEGGPIGCDDRPKVGVNEPHWDYDFESDYIMFEYGSTSYKYYSLRKKIT